MQSTIHYAGGSYLGTPGRRDFLKSDLLEDAITFFPVDVEDAVEFVDSRLEYRLRLTGFTRDGNKTIVTVNDIDVFFDVYVGGNKMDVSKANMEILVMLDSAGIVHKSTETFYAKKFFGYSEDNEPF